MSHNVGVLLVAACLAPELGLALPIGACAMTAFRTRLAGVPRVHRDHGDTGSPRLVTDERSELRERPARKPISCLSAPNGNPVADTLEILQRDAASGALGLGDDCLRDPVVLMAAKSGFLLGDPFQFLLRPFGSLLLESLSLEVVLAPDIFDRLAAVLGPVAISGDIGDAQVNSEEIGDRHWGCVRNVHGDDEEPLAVLPQHEIGLPPGQRHAFTLVTSQDEGHDDAAFECEQTYPIEALETHDPLVIESWLQPAETTPFERQWRKRSSWGFSPSFRVV